MYCTELIVVLLFILIEWKQTVSTLFVHIIN